METLKKFLREGKLLAPELYKRVENLSEEEVQDLLQSDSLVLSEKNLRRLEVPEPKILKREKRERELVHVSDFTQFYLNRFNFLKEEIQKKLEPEKISSINKLSSGEASVIGMVRELKDGKVVLEDQTGRVVLETDKKFLEDEVVGVKGSVIVDKEARMRPDKVFYPGVPLHREVRKAEQDLSALFLSQLDKKTEKLIDDLEPDYLFLSKELDAVPEISVEVPVVGISDQRIQRANFKVGEDPVWVQVAGLQVLLHGGRAVNEAKEKLSMEQPRALISLLQRRHLNPAQMRSLEDRYLIRKVPDILHVHGEQAVANYKGVTLLSTSTQKGYLIDLSTRDIEEVDL